MLMYAAIKVGAVPLPLTDGVKMPNSERPASASNPSFLAGEVHALIVFAQVLVSIPALRDGLREQFDSAEQIGLDKLKEGADNESLESGFLFAVHQIRRSLETSVKVSGGAVDFEMQKPCCTEVAGVG
jgi:hypothetical protein